MVTRTLRLALVLVPFLLANPGCSDEDASCQIDAADFDQSCAVAADCAIVADGMMCGDACRCPLAVINEKDLAEFKRQVAAIDESQGGPPDHVCDCDAIVDVECVAGQCRGIDGTP